MAFPHEYQLDAKDCGPACLKIIAKFYGKYYSLQYLRDLCGITREGVSLLDISYAADKIGLRSISVKITIIDLITRIALPAVIHWDNNHFVVIYKATNKRIYVSDPAKGLISYTHEQFVEKWYKNDEPYGVLMVLEPMANFRQIEAHEKIERLKSFENLLGYFTPYKRAFGILFLIMLVATILQAFLPFIAKAVIDTGIRTQDVNFVYLVLAANVILLLSITLSNVLRDWILLHVTTRVNISLISDYLIKLMKLPVSFFENKLVGDILQRAYDHERIRHFIMNNSMGMLFSSITFVIFSSILLIFNKSIFFIFLAGSLLYLLWVFLFLKVRNKLDWEYFDLLSKDRSYWVETIENIQEIKINNYEDTKRWKWEAIQARLYRLNVKILNINNAQMLGSQFINNMQNMAITFFCVIAVIEGDITFGIMISTQFIIGMLNGPVAQFVGFVQSAQYSKISFMRINEIHQLQDEDDLVSVSANSMELPNNKSLNVKNLSFAYSPHAPLVIKGINFAVPEGKVTAIVGDSGCGKSTLLKLLLRLYLPSYGEISIGDMNLNNVSLRQWRARCGSVMQEGKVFNDTIQNNIILNEEKVDYQALKRATDIANISKEIEAMPQGYQTMIGELGRGLSGGQKQRLLIARALYKDPDYLFLDEATNALDTINEQKIVTALNNVFKNRTVIVIAHRLSTIKKADQIIVMKEGSIMELGTHDRLMENKRHYYELIQSQYDLEPVKVTTEVEG
ncbi:peptidase domain-containing ABC transporter [Sphingobacterium bambusae]|uniref:Peptidase domain-containing ABC transporter n=1 Tax=Sphingobacterium bambusae TaxID=662858 RepID=A0ABW6BE05_9SPHI|nr:peptidase domain-containing ABC transporter [Sphingobacterium bambusae]WPL47465.1 peptidase domain-containing ABC transporter [Sphingobacterium bambusae]